MTIFDLLDEFEKANEKFDYLCTFHSGDEPLKVACNQYKLLQKQLESSCLMISSVLTHCD